MKSTISDPLNLKGNDVNIKAIEETIQEYAQQNPNEILGVFITGSVAKQEYNEKTSDLDILIVLSDTIVASNLHQLFEDLRGIKTQIDCVAVKEKNLTTQPTLVDFIFKSAFEEVKENVEREDFLLNQKDCFVCGIQIGGSINNYGIPDVPPELIRKSVKYLFPFVVEYFKNPVLMLLRLAYVIDTNHMCGKKEVAKWGMEHFDSQYHDMIDSDLQSYCIGEKTVFPAELLKSLEHEIRERYLND